MKIPLPEQPPILVEPPESPVPLCMGAATARPTQSLAVPLLRFYLLTLATFGVYLAWRGYQTARRLDPRGRSGRGRCLAWASAAFFYPAGCAVLFETSRLARLALQPLGVLPRGRSLLLAPGLCLGLSAFLTATRLSILWTPFILLLPVPALLAQDELNRLETACGDRTARPQRRVVLLSWALVALGLPVSAFALVKLDGKNVAALRSSRSLVAATRVAGTQPSYDLRVPSVGWQQVAPGILGDGTEDLAFRKHGGASWVLVYRSSTGGLSLDDVVSDRRRLLAEDRRSIDTFDERRFFLNAPNLEPASFARYGLSSAGEAGVMVVMATLLGDIRIEAIGYSNPANQRDVEEFVLSLRDTSRSW